ncbi:MAG: type VI secretion system baseplate subunit TssF [Burkholderiaceae bacterium]|nr:type VI secretion system baseplate subunit TssF [Burkholderiaceae bacterium]
MHATDNDILDYYQRELAWLREQGQDFARRYPKVGARLDLHGGESRDPHTERLIESVAFLTARVRRDIDAEFPQVATALLDNLCPSLLAPIPSMTVVQMELDGGQGKVTAGLRVPRHGALVASADGGEEVRFRTAWETTLWPLSVADARVDDDGCIALRIAAHRGADLAELELDTLRLHLCGDWGTVATLFECLAVRLRSIAVEQQDGRLQRLPPSACARVGFEPGQAVLPQAPGAHPAYALLQEYFAFPQKFHFFDIRGLRALKLAGDEFTLRIDAGGTSRRLRQLAATNIRLGCVVAVNLFPRTSEPVQIDHTRHEVLLVGDRVREAHTEIHTIEQVTASDPGSDRPVPVPHFSSLQHAAVPDDGVYWSARRERSLRRGITGTDLFLSFVDQRNMRSAPSSPVIYARTLCTNRGLAEQVTRETRLRGEGMPGGLVMRCLVEPSPQRNPPLDAETVWRLASLLTLNHGTLAGGDTGRDRLREILALFASDQHRDLEQIRGIAGLNARPVTRQIGGEAWRGHCRGTGLRLELDAEAFVGSSTVLFSAVLAHFFSLYTTVNSFVELGVWRGDECLLQWKPMVGARELV